MPQAHFSLAWDKYRNVMCSGFSALQQNGEFVDMTIAADGHLVKAHQMVVGLASPYLKELIQSAPCPHPVLFLNNVSHQILCSILEYVYTGEVAVEADKLTLFIETAKALHIKGLDDMLQYSSESQADASAQDTHLYHVPLSPISVQAVSKPGTNTLQLQVLGDKPTEIALPTTARNIVMKRDMPLIHSPVPEKRRTIEVQSKSIVPEEVSYMEEDHIDESAVDAEDDELDTTEPLTSAQDYKLSSVVSTPSSQQHGDMQYTISNRGALQLILNRYMYNLASRSKNGSTRRWKCVDYRNAKCPATATTEDNVVSSREEDVPRERFWRCVDYRHQRCPALLYTVGDVVTQRVAMHNHPFHDKRILSKIEKKAVFSAIKSAEEASNREAVEED